jgi:hypothetical protein
VSGRYSKGVLWSPSYFAASCGGAPLSIIAEYVRNQREGALPPRPEGRGLRKTDENGHNGGDHRIGSRGKNE